MITRLTLRIRPLSRAAALCLLLFTLQLSLFSAGDETYPKPNPAAKFSELKLYDLSNKKRPWRVAREDWDNARNLIATDPAWKKWLSAERTQVDRWMATHHDRVEWIAGWSHDGVSPKDGSALQWIDKIPGEEIEYFTSLSDPKVAITPKLKAWWVVTFRDRHNTMMNRAAHLYKLTGETRYAEWAASQLDFYADNFTKWEPQRRGQQARLYWQTLTEASNLIIYADTARLLGDYVAPKRLAKWHDQFFYPEVEAINSNFQNIHNIATWQRCAAAQVALLFHDEKMWDTALDGKYGLRAQMAKGITSDYLWYEQSLGYNNFVVTAVLTLFTNAGLHGRAPLLDYEMTVAENLMLSTTYMRFPDGILPNPADSKGRQTAPNPENFAHAYRVFPTKLGLATAATSHNWDTLLDSPAEIATHYKFQTSDFKNTPDSLPLVTNLNMETSRMAILRNGPWQVYFHYGQITRSHAQNEALNYELYYNDTDISHDSGVVGYGSPLYNGYYTRGANHNVPLIDGEGQETLPELGKLLAYVPATKTQPARVAAAQPNYRKNASTTRTIEITPEKFTDTVTIKTTDGAPHALGLAIQLQGKLRSTTAFQPVADFAQNRPTLFTYWKDTTVADFTDHAEFDIEYPGKLPVRVTILLSGKFRIYKGSTPDIPPHRRETLYIEQQGTETTFTTTLAPTVPAAAVKNIISMTETSQN